MIHITEFNFTSDWFQSPQAAHERTQIPALHCPDNRASCCTAAELCKVLPELPRASHLLFLHA